MRVCICELLGESRVPVKDVNLDCLPNKGDILFFCTSGMKIKEYIVKERVFRFGHVDNDVIISVERV